MIRGGNYLERESVFEYVNCKHVTFKNKFIWQNYFKRLFFKRLFKEGKEILNVRKHMSGSVSSSRK